MTIGFEETSTTWCLLERLFHFQGTLHLLRAPFPQNAVHGVACYQELLVCRDDECMQGGIVRTDLTFLSVHPVVSVLVNPQPCPFEALADTGSDFPRVLPDASCEDNRIGASHAG